MRIRFWITLFCLGAALTYAAFNNAGVDPPSWHWTMLGVGLIGCLHFGVNASRDAPCLDRFSLWTAGLFLLVAAAQLLPLPIDVIRVISPNRAAIAEAVFRITGSPARFVPISVVPRQTAEYLITLAGYAVVALTIRDLTLRASASRWITSIPLLIVGALEAILGLLQNTFTTRDVSGAGTFANRDHYAGLLEMVLPFAVMIAISALQGEENRHESPAGPAIRACIFLAVAAALLVAVIDSLSRMGFLASLAALFVCGSISLSLRGYSIEYEVSTNWLRRWLPSLLVALVVLLGFVLLPTDPLIARFSDLARTDEISADTRIQIWRDTVHLFRSFPLFGCGLGAYYSSLFPYKTAAPMSTVDFAHNDYLQVLTEMGVVGFTFGLLFLFRVLQLVVRGARFARSSETRNVAIACIASMTAMLLHSIVDFNMYVPVNGFVFAWILGIAGVSLGQRRSSVRRVERQTAVLVNA